jgi:hypothetical protein
MEIKGKIILIGATETLGKDFKKREVVIETTEEQYPQKLKVEFIKDKCSALDGYKVGDNVVIGINLRGNEYQGKFYVSIQGWKINRVGANTTTSQSTAKVQPSASANTINEDNDPNIDLPF